ncbi:hypothetical protein [Modestobacter lapidis]|nr:hypothetical protein [Modestobacter lapidis]
MALAGNGSDLWTFEAWFELAARRVGRGVGLLTLDRPADLADPRLSFVLRTVDACLGDLEQRWVQRLDAATPAQQQPPADVRIRLKALEKLQDPLILHLLTLSTACAENNRKWDLAGTWEALVKPTLRRFELAYTAMPDPHRGATFGVHAALATVRQEFSAQLLPPGDRPGKNGDPSPPDRPTQPAAAAAGKAATPGSRASAPGSRASARTPPPATTRQVVTASLGVLAAAAAVVVGVEAGWGADIAQGVLSTLVVEALRPAVGIARGHDGPDTGTGLNIGG